MAQGAGGGRPKIKIDPEQVRRLASIFCTMQQIGHVVGCSVDTLERRFADIIKEGRDMGRTSLLKKQYEVAMTGNVSMLIWLGKQHLQQSDKQEVKQDVEMKADHKISQDQIIDIVKKTMK